MIWNTLSICTVVWSLGMQWDAWFVLWAWSYQSCMGECMGPHTFCMEPPIHAWCAQYSYEHTVHDLICCYVPVEQSLKITYEKMRAVHEFKSLYRYFVPTVYQYRCYTGTGTRSRHTVGCWVCAVGLKSGWEICAVAYSPVYFRS